MKKKNFILIAAGVLCLLAVVLLLRNQSVEETVETTEAVVTRPADFAGVEIGSSDYYCTTEQSAEMSLSSRNATFTHTIYNPNYEYIATLTTILTGTAAEENAANLISVSAKLSEEAVEDISISEHLSGDTATVIVYLADISVCYFQYRLLPDGTFQFL